MTRCFRSFRFAVEFDFEPIVGTSAVEVRPAHELLGAGVILLETCFTADINDILQKISSASTVTVGLYAEDDDKPTIHMLLALNERAVPRVMPLKLEATSADILTFACELQYDSLSFIKGNNALDWLAAAS